jgi:hypothetical protein
MQVLKQCWSVNNFYLRFCLDYLPLLRLLMFIYVLLLSLGRYLCCCTNSPSWYYPPSSQCCFSTASELAYGLLYMYIFNWRYMTLIMFSVWLTHSLTRAIRPLVSFRWTLGWVSEWVSQTLNMIKVMYLQLNRYMYNKPYASSEAVLKQHWLLGG